MRRSYCSFTPISTVLAISTAPQATTTTTATGIVSVTTTAPLSTITSKVTNTITNSITGTTYTTSTSTSTYCQRAPHLHQLHPCESHPSCLCTSKKLTRPYLFVPPELPFWRTSCPVQLLSNLRSTLPVLQMLPQHVHHNDPRQPSSASRPAPRPWSRLGHFDRLYYYCHDDHRDGDEHLPRRYQLLPGNGTRKQFIPADFY